MGYRKQENDRREQNPMEHFAAAERLIEQHAGLVSCAGGAGAALVDAMAARLGVWFPRSLRAFYLKYGAVSAGGQEFAGISEGDYAGLSLRSINGTAVRGGLPVGWLVIADAGDGGWYVIPDLGLEGARTPGGVEPPVLFWWYGSDVGDAEQEAWSFGSFFRMAVEQELEWAGERGARVDWRE